MLEQVRPGTSPAAGRPCAVTLPFPPPANGEKAIACGGEFNEQKLRRAAGPSPLILFHQAEKLLDGQLAKLCSYLASGGNRPAGVLLGVPGLVPRLEKLQPSLFEEQACDLLQLLRARPR